MARVHVVVPEGVHLAAKAEAQARGITLKQLVITGMRHEAEAGKVDRVALDRPGVGRRR